MKKLFKIIIFVGGTLFFGFIISKGFSQNLNLILQEELKTNENISKQEEYIIIKAFEKLLKIDDTKNSQDQLDLTKNQDIKELIDTGNYLELTETSNNQNLINRENYKQNDEKSTNSRIYNAPVGEENRDSTNIGDKQDTVTIGENNNSGHKDNIEDFQDNSLTENINYTKTKEKLNTSTPINNFVVKKKLTGTDNLCNQQIITIIGMTCLPNKDLNLKNKVIPNAIIIVIFSILGISFLTILFKYIFNFQNLEKNIDKIYKKYLKNYKKYESQTNKFKKIISKKLEKGKIDKNLHNSLKEKLEEYYEKIKEKIDEKGNKSLKDKIEDKIEKMYQKNEIKKTEYEKLSKILEQLTK